MAACYSVYIYTFLSKHTLNFIVYSMNREFIKLRKRKRKKFFFFHYNQRSRHY